MNTKFLMTASALFMGIIGIAITFLPQELAAYLGAENNSSTVLLIQILGAAYMGFGFLNWMGKGNIIGGIYNRPVAVGNMIHFSLVAITLIKLAFAQEASGPIIPLAIVYSLFAFGFIHILRKHPKAANTDT